MASVQTGNRHPKGESSRSFSTRWAWTAEFRRRAHPTGAPRAASLTDPDHLDSTLLATCTSTTKANGRTTTGGNTTTTFTWDVAAGLPVVLDDGAQYVYGGGGLEAMKASGSWYYYLADGLGSTMAIVDSSGTVQKSYTYDVYGKPAATGSLANEHDFAGQQTDATGLQYLRARYMDPETGTFLSRDPLTAEPTWAGSPFAYAAANPANLTDPSGLCAIWDLRCHVKQLGGLNDSEERYCMRGPNTFQKCLKARSDANDATGVVSSVFPGQDSDLTAAFRHCLWSGFMTCRWGSGQAKIFGDRHEDWPDNPENTKNMGLWNNAIGRAIGEYYRGREDARALVAEECLGATFDGRLITNRHIFDRGGMDASGGDLGF